MDHIYRAFLEGSLLCSPQREIRYLQDETITQETTVCLAR
jgi:hypothetical protein